MEQTFVSKERADWQNQKRGRNDGGVKKRAKNIQRRGGNESRMQTRNSRERLKEVRLVEVE